MISQHPENYQSEIENLISSDFSIKNFLHFANYFKNKLLTELNNQNKKSYFSFYNFYNSAATKEIQNLTVECTKSFKTIADVYQFINVIKNVTSNKTLKEILKINNPLQRELESGLTVISKNEKALLDLKIKIINHSICIIDEQKISNQFDFSKYKSDGLYGSKLIKNHAVQMSEFQKKYNHHDAEIEKLKEQMVDLLIGIKKIDFNFKINLPNPKNDEIQSLLKVLGKAHADGSDIPGVNEQQKESLHVEYAAKLQTLIHDNDEFKNATPEKVCEIIEFLLLHKEFSKDILDNEIKIAAIFYFYEKMTDDKQDDFINLLFAEEIKLDSKYIYQTLENVTIKKEKIIAKSRENLRNIHEKVRDLKSRKDLLQEDLKNEDKGADNPVLNKINQINKEMAIAKKEKTAIYEENKKLENKAKRELILNKLTSNNNVLDDIFIDTLTQYDEDVRKSHLNFKLTNQLKELKNKITISDSAGWDQRKSLTTVLKTLYLDSFSYLLKNSSFSFSRNFENEFYQYALKSILSFKLINDLERLESVEIWRHLITSEHHKFQLASAFNANNLSAKKLLWYGLIYSEKFKRVLFNQEQNDNRDNNTLLFQSTDDVAVLNQAGIREALDLFDQLKIKKLINEIQNTVNVSQYSEVNDCNGDVLQTIFTEYKESIDQLLSGSAKTPEYKINLLNDIQEPVKLLIESYIASFNAVDACFNNDLTSFKQLEVVIMQDKNLMEENKTFLISLMQMCIKQYEPDLGEPKFHNDFPEEKVFESVKLDEKISVQKIAGTNKINFLLLKPKVKPKGPDDTSVNASKLNK